MALSDAFAAERETVPPGPVCGIFTLLAALGPDDAAFLRAQLADDTATHSYISRALTRAGHKVSAFTVSWHRTGRCSCGAR